MVRVKLMCNTCSYEEEQERQAGTTFDGLKCPNCEDGELAEQNEEDEEE